MQPRTFARTLTSILVLSSLAISTTAVPRCQADDRDAIRQAKALSRAFRSAAQRVIPSVVTVIAKVRVRAIDPRELFRDPRNRWRSPGRGSPFYFPSQRSSSGEDSVEEVDAQLGSGVIIRPNGTVLTNNHVVEDADRVVIRLADGREVDATDIRTDRMSDLAIMRISAPGPFQAAKLGDSSKLEIGDWVIAIGSPFELDATVSAGIISGKGRSIEKIERGKFLQTDAAINPGNSGGPLVNLDGEVVGINTAIASNSGGYQGIGFAIPINHARWIATQLAEKGRVHRGYLGIYIRDMDAKLAAQYERPVHSGVIVSKVVNGTAAKAAGMRDGDVIVSFAGSKVRDLRDLQTVVEQKPPGSTQRLTVMRNGGPLQLRVVVREMPSNEPK